MTPAHHSPLAESAFDASGTSLTTASEKVTVIRECFIPEGQKLFEFQRGVKRCASSCSLAFSLDGVFLSTSSNTETVHLLKLETAGKTSGGAHHLDWVLQQGAHGFPQLLCLPKYRNVEPGQSLCHSLPAFLRP